MSELVSRSREEETERTFKLFARYAGEGDEEHIISTPLREDEAIMPEDLKVTLGQAGVVRPTQQPFLICNQRLARVLGVPVSLEELDDMVKEFDTSGDGTSGKPHICLSFHPLTLTRSQHGRLALYNLTSGQHRPATQPIKLKYFAHWPDPMGVYSKRYIAPIFGIFIVFW
jgi:hypothetical protein